MRLNDQQVDFLQNKLEEKGLSYQPLMEDILDHICCMVEKEMEQGWSFHQAYQHVLADFGENGIKKIQNQTLLLIHQNSLIMKRLSFLVLLFILISFSVLIAQQHNFKLRNPVQSYSKINAGFGEQHHPILNKMRFHKGIDIAAPTGTPVLATRSGKIVKTKDAETGYGKHIIIEHDGIFSSMYAHLSEIQVEVGQIVEAGDVIGLVGSSGSSTAPHLHYELRENGKAIDPKQFMTP